MVSSLTVSSRHGNQPPVFDAIQPEGDDGFSFMSRDPEPVKEVKQEKKPEPPVAKKPELPSPPKPQPEAVKAPVVTTATKAPQALTAKRHGTFWGVMVLVALLVIEGSGVVVYSALSGQLFSFEKAKTERAQILGDTSETTLQSLPAETGDTSLVVHPYLGYIQSPGDKWVTPGHGIFYGTRPIITAPISGKVVVGILGGSVAEQFSAQGIARLEETLQQNPRFAGKTLEIVPITFAGYKQPQQLMALNYFLSLGAYFDLLINIDGFNEVALSTALNGPKNVSPFYPSSWAALAGSLPDTGQLKLIGKTANLKDLRKVWASAFDGFLGSTTVTANVVWLAGDRMLTSSLSGAETELTLGEADDAQKTLALGPEDHNPTDDDVLQSVVQSWERSSLQMHEVASAKGIPYFHFLQPNQYGGNKPMSPEEAKTALNDASPFKPWVIAGYPLLRQAGDRLKASGVRFMDLSQIFEKTQETTYIDNCCHLTPNGYELLGEWIGAVIVQDVP